MKETVKVSNEVVKTWEVGDLFYWKGLKFVEEMEEDTGFVDSTIEETSEEIREVTSREAIEFHLRIDNPLEDVPTRDLLNELSNRLK